jgi:AAA+ ATPase superfamily predicted ATPase
MNENYTKLANFVINLPQEIYNEYKSEIKGVFVFFDEFQLLKELDQQLDSFLWFLRSNIQDQKNVAYVLTGSMSLKDDFIERVAGNSGAFGGRILTLEITPFSYETTKSYLEEKAEHLNFTEDGFKQFYNCTRGIPTYINTFAKCLPQNVVLDKDRLKKEFKGILPILAMHYINLWYELTNQEQKIITCLLENPLKRKDLAEKLDVTTGSISKPLKKLQNLILIELDNKEYRIADPILKLWLEDYYDKYQIYPYRTP